MTYLSIYFSKLCSIFDNIRFITEQQIYFTHFLLICKDIYCKILNIMGFNKKIPTIKLYKYPKLKLPLPSLLYFVTLNVYLELIFHGYHFILLSVNTLRALFFAALLSLVPAFIVSLLPELAAKITATIFTLLITAYYLACFLYYSVFKNHLSLAGTVRYANQAADNSDTVWQNVLRHPVMMLLIIVPSGALIFVLWRYILLNREPLINSFILLAALVVLYPSSIIFMGAVSKSHFSAYNVYKTLPSIDLAVEKLGVMEAFTADLRLAIFPNNNFELSFAETGGTTAAPTTEAMITDIAEDMNKTEETTVTTTEKPIDTSPQVMDIDFDKISEEAGGGVASLCDYFKSLTPTNKNEYTGLFEGMNVVWITAEGFSGYLFETDKFPTLKMMSEKGFHFTNYYQPIWYGSTLGGEYANLLGSPTRNGGYLSMYQASNNKAGMYFSLANNLNKLGYHSYGFHNNDYDYYDRNISHPLLGYEWIANGSGLEPQYSEYGNVLWPQSDQVMIEDTFDKYTKDEPFNLYYLTVSGHVNYNFAGNAMAARHKAEVDKMNYDETTKAYIACQIELELAVEDIVTRLKKKGLYENTVIIIAGDHVPYNDLNVLDSLAREGLDKKFELYKSSLIIFSGAMEKSVRVDKVCSSIDILPTVLNLMGVEYDSRLIIGQDILSDSPGFVIYPDMSFMTDDFCYYAPWNETFDKRGNDREVDEATVSYWNNYAANKMIAANGIIDYDFYRYISEE